MPAKLFKDFNKDTKDLLTKSYIAPGAWKLESKIKPADKDFGINPNFDVTAKATSVSVDIDYNVKEQNLKTKTNVTPAGTIKPKLTYEAKGHKVELTVNNITDVNSEFELTYEGGYVCGASVFDKVTKKNADLSASYVVGPLTVGAGAVIAFGKGLEKWSAGVRFADKGIVANVTTVGLKTYTTGVFFPLAISNYKFKWAAQVECGGKFGATAGFEVPVCCLTLKAKATNEGAVTLALIRKFSDSWTGAFTFSAADCCKVGVHLTRE